MGKAPAVELIDLETRELDELLERVGDRLADSDYQLIQRLVQTLQLLLGLLEKKNMSLRRLRRLIFGARTEKTKDILPAAPPAEDSKPKHPKTPPENKPKPKGHGRNGAKDYPGAQRIKVSHGSLQAGENCPDCAREGKLYAFNPGTEIRIVAQPLFPATLYELEKLRCSACGKIFTAKLPDQAGPQKYDPRVGPQIALLRYGCGMPFYRLEKMQADFGVPLPASTQWQLVWEAAQPAFPVYQELLGCAAQGEVLYNDDTSMTVLSLLKASSENQEQKSGTSSERTGIFTTGIISTWQHRQIALFFTGQQHAGENLHDLLQHRDPRLPPPIQMCDGLSRNQPKDFEVILANCTAHSRRYFVDAAPNFPEPCRYVLESLRQVYRNEAQAKEQGLCAQQRLLFHQTHSQQIMDDLHEWLNTQLDQKLVEPNSGLGEAISYMLKRWQPLTLFLRKSGAPLDNNIAEQGLKRAILHRKNSQCFKTENGAKVGDLFMGLIHTCRLNQINPFDYLCALQFNPKRVEENPAAWLPWNYKENLESADTS